MDLAPLYRRPGFVGFIGLGIVAGIYYVTARAIPDAVQYTLFSLTIMILGLVSVLSLFIFIANLLFWIREPLKTLAAFLRLALLGIWIPLNIYAILDASSPIVRTVITHIDLGLLILIATIAISAQFVLPVRKVRNRSNVIRRLLGFLVGERGPVTYIRDGEAREAYEERLRRAPGVFLIDFNSAAVLRTDIQFTRAIGPGVAFTHRGEWRAESLDLRRQIRTTKAVTPGIGEPAKLDRVSSLAVTQDGIPVSTDLNLTFMLDPGHSVEPREGRDPNLPPYEFNQTAVEKAVYGHAFSEFEDLPWTELPIRLAVDLWREMIKEKTLNELVSQEKDDTLPLQILKEQIQTRLTSPTVETRTHNGKRQLEASREYAVLRSRGIRVLSVGGLHTLNLPDDVRRERMLQWRETWAGGIQEALAEAKEEIKHIRYRGEAEAYYILLRDLTTKLRAKLREGSQPEMRDTLRDVFDDAIRLCSQRGLVADGANLAIQLNEMLDELSTLDENCFESSLGEGP